MKKIVLIDVNEYPKKTFRLKKDDNVTIVIVVRNPKVQEARCDILLDGRGARATVIGIVIDLKRDFILHTLQDHKVPETTSDLLIKSVVTGTAKFSFDGAIRVERKAQKTDAYQRNENLLLSDTAQARSDPSLEILANDVRCTHGATVGQISDEELWYLASRGISAAEGRGLIVQGFLESALSRISDTIIREKVRLWLTQN